MNEPTLRLDVRPEVSAFVDQVRARLADLSEEEREELVGGLEADLAELVADGGSVAELGDPRAYADELRAAAGVPKGSLPRIRGGVGRAVHGVLDEARGRWEELMSARATREVWAVVGSLRGAWWVLRAWLAVQLLAGLTGFPVLLIPEFRSQLVGFAVLAAAVVGSVQLGRGKLWLSSDRSRPVLGRLVLLGLNIVAILVIPFVLAWYDAERRPFEVYEGASTPGLVNGDQPVQNVFPYDAQGRPLQGVQLFDQDGNPLFVPDWVREDWMGSRVMVTYPYFNGEQRLFNVFPLPVREQGPSSAGIESAAWTSTNPPALPQHPLAVVPPAALPTEAPTEAPVADADSEKPSSR